MSNCEWKTGFLLRRAGMQGIGRTFIVSPALLDDLREAGDHCVEIRYQEVREIPYEPQHFEDNDATT